MRSSTFALAVLALAAVASVGDARLMGRALASGPDADGDIEPSQLFMIVCLSIGAFVMLVALIACLLVLKRFGGAATSEPTGPAFAGVPGMAAVGSPYAPMFMPQPMYMQQQQQQQMPMQMVPMQMPMQKSAVPMPMPYQQPAQQQQAPSAVQPISAMSRARMNADDHNEVADIHGDNNARVQQMVAEAGAGAGAGADGSSHGFQAHQA